MRAESVIIKDHQRIKLLTANLTMPIKNSRTKIKKFTIRLNSLFYIKFAPFSSAYAFCSKSHFNNQLIESFRHYCTSVHREEPVQMYFCISLYRIRESSIKVKINRILHSNRDCVWLNLNEVAEKKFKLHFCVKIQFFSIFPFSNFSFFQSVHQKLKLNLFYHI